MLEDAILGCLVGESVDRFDHQRSTLRDWSVCMNIGREFGPDLISSISNGFVQAIVVLTPIESILLRSSSIVGNL